MKVEDILKFLQSLGLNENEAKAYATLSMTGPMKAGDVSKESGVPQSKVYWILEGLIEKQLVEVSDAKPKEYKAAAADLALRRLVEEKEKSITSVKSELKEISGYLKPAKAGETMSGIWTMRGRNWLEFFNKASEMVARSRKYVYGFTRDYSKSAKLAEVVESATKRGVKIRVIGLEGIAAENFFRAKWFVEHGAELKILETKIHPRIVVIDGKEVLLRLDHDHLKKDGFPFSSVWSQDPSLVSVFDTYAKNIWDSAKPVNLKEIERRIVN